MGDVVVSKALASALARGRTTGNFELSGKNLSQVPSAVYHPDEAFAEGDKGSWWENAEITRVNVSRNRLKTIPSGLSELPSLTYLDVSHNQIEELPQSLSQLTGLKVLAASNNDIQILPEHVANLPELMKLDVQGNKLESVPIALGTQQQRLVEVSLASNALREFPTGLNGCTTLSNVNVSNNKLDSLPANFLQAAVNLRELDASDNCIGGVLDDSIGQLRKLTVLNLRHNQLVGVGSGIQGCTALVELHLGFNGLRSIPEEIGLLQSLRVLDLRSNQLTEFPKGACSLKLNSLDLMNNSLTVLPAELGCMTTLRGIKLEGNPLRAVRPSLVSGPVSALLEHLRSKLPEALQTDDHPLAASPFARPVSWQPFNNMVDAAADSPCATPKGGGSMTEIVIRSANLTQVPKDVELAADSLVKLDLSRNKIKQIEVQLLTQSSNLMVLLLPDNNLSQWPLPTTFHSMARLAQLSLARNPIPEITQDAFACCSNSLKVLDLSGVPAAGVPGGLTAATVLKQLSELSLMRCNLRSFPPELLCLPSLQHINLASNTMEELPGSITQLSSLAFLDVSNNNLRTLPPQLGLMVNTLKALMLDGNPLRAIRRTVLDKGTQHLLEYLQTRIPT